MSHYFHGKIQPANPEATNLSPDNQVSDLDEFIVKINATNSDWVYKNLEGTKHNILAKYLDGKYVFVKKDWKGSLCIKWFELKDGKIVQKQP